METDEKKVEKLTTQKDFFQSGRKCSPVNLGMVTLRGWSIFLCIYYEAVY